MNEYQASNSAFEEVDWMLIEDVDALFNEDKRCGALWVTEALTW